MLSPLLFNIFFAAVPSVVLQRLIEEPPILAEVVHLKEPPTSMGPEPAMDYVRRPVWGMLYADDACVVAKMMMEVIVEVCRALALTVSVKKTETMCASTAYTADDGVNGNGRAKVPTGAILHLRRGRGDPSPGHVR